MSDQSVLSKSLKEMHNIIEGRIPLSYIVTSDEERCIKDIYNKLCLDKNETQVRDLFIWSSYSGLNKFTPTLLDNPVRASGDFEGSVAIPRALELVQNFTNPKNTESIFIFRDFYTALSPGVARQLKDIYSSLIFSNQEKPKFIIGMGNMLGHFHGAIKPGMEPSLEKQMRVVNWDLPTREEIEALLKHELEGSESAIKYTDEDIYRISRVLQGLTTFEIDNAISLCAVEVGRLDPKYLLGQKKQIIMRSEVLEFIESDESMDQLGGLDQLKEYIKNNANSHSEDAEAFGVDPLKGILLLGIPGTGKSATAKGVGNFWGLPTIRLDIGRVMGSLVGMSEQRMRDAIKTAESIAPVILWCDEIEKALSGTKSSSHSDGGTLNRVFGTLLTAMQEGMKGVVVIATANDISLLPPELIRRFSETFYVSIPTAEERKDIWKIWLTKKKRDPAKFDLDILSAQSDKFTGAEISKSLSEAIATCYNDGKREMTTNDLVIAIKNTKPIAVVMSTEINKTEEWAKTRTRYASSQAEQLAKPGMQKVKLGSGEVKISDLDKDIPSLTAQSPTRLSSLSKKNKPQ